MSSDESPNVPAERHRRHAVREKAQQVQAQQSRARLIRTTSLAAVIVAVVAVAAVVVTWVVTSSASQPLLSPTNVTDDGIKELLPLSHQLEAIDIRLTSVSDSSVPVLKRFPQLTLLRVQGSAFTEQGRSKIRQSLLHRDA